MILNIRFRNYRSFKEESVFTMEASSSSAKPENVVLCPLPESEGKRVLKTSVVFGANASGKTNLIRILYVLVKMVRNEYIKPGKGIIFYEPFKFEVTSKESPIEFYIDFIAKGIKYAYQFSFNRKDILSESLISYPLNKPRLLFERIIEIENDVEKHKIKSGPSLGKIDFEVFNNQLILSKFAIDTPHDAITPASLYLSSVSVTNAYNSNMLDSLLDDVLEWTSSNKKHKKKLIELLSFADTGVNDFNIKKKNGSLYDDVNAIHNFYDGKVLKGKVDLSLREESFGTRNLFILGGKILQALEEGLPLFVDEIDCGFHTYITKLLMSLFRDERINKKNAQLILTTHDVNLLDQYSVRKDQVWFAEKNSNGESELFSLSDFEGVREDTPFAKWYMADKFGAVPTLLSLEKLFSEDSENA